MTKTPPATPHPRLEDVVHPSIQEDPIALNLPVDLTCVDFRAYKNGAGRIVLRLRSVLLITTSTGFSVGAYLHSLSGTLYLPEQGLLELDELSVTEDLAIPFDGKRMAIDLWAGAQTNLRTIRPCFGDLSLQVDFNIHGAPFRGVVQRLATIQRRYK